MLAKVWSEPELVGRDELETVPVHNTAPDQLERMVTVRFWGEASLSLYSPNLRVSIAILPCPAEPTTKD